MGDRSGLPKIDRTNGFDDGRDYMRVKKSKLAQQNDQIREALRNRNSTSKTDLFKGISINVNGRTQPTADELKRLILLNGGDYHPYYRYQTTKFMIATNLSTARMKTLRPDDRVIRPEWITESIQAKCLLPYEDYQLFVEEPRGKNGNSVLIINDRTTTKAITNGQSTSNELASSSSTSIVESYSSSYRKNSRHKSSQNEVSKSRDIREMFSKCVRSINNGESSCSKKKLDTVSGSNSNSSSQSSINSNSNDSDIKQVCSQNKLDEETTSRKIYNIDDDEEEASRSSTKSEPTMKHRDSRTTSSSKNKKKTLTMSDFVIKGAKPNRFPAPKVPEKKTLANICGLTNLDDVIGILNEWVGCPEGVKDEDTACVTKYFYDLMNEKNYHNKLYEIIDAFQQRVIQHDEPSWKIVYNNLVDSIKGELNHGAEASQNLNQLLTLVDVPSTSQIDNISISSSQRRSSLPTIPEIEID